MSSLRPEDIYCDSYSEKKSATAKATNKSFDPTSRPLKPRKKEHRRSVELKMKIRRNLFGPVDHENTENFLKKELDILSDLSNRKWNFDFGEEKPMDGPWLWESVGQNDPAVPSAYRGTLHMEDHHMFNKCEIQRPCSQTQSPLVLGVSTEHVNLNVARRNSPSLSIRQNSIPSSKSREAKRKVAAVQPSLKGFLTVKKRKQSQLSLSPDKTKCKGRKDNSNPTLLQIIKSVSPVKTCSYKDNVAL